MMKVKIVTPIFLFAAMVFVVPAWAETMEMVTYYPGAAGDPDRSHANRASVGAAYNRTIIPDSPVNLIPDGTLLVATRLGIRLPLLPSNNPPTNPVTAAPLGILHVAGPGGFGAEDGNGISGVTNIPILAQSDSTVFGILNSQGRPAFALNIDFNGGTNSSRGVPTFYDKYDSAWHPSISLRNGNVGVGTPNASGNNNPLGILHAAARTNSGFAAENADGTSNVNDVPLLAQSNSTAIGILNGNNRPAFALNIDSNGGTNVARGVPTFYDKYDSAWHPGISLKNGKVGIGGISDPVFALDVADRIRLRQGPLPGWDAGLWLYQSSTSSDQAFVGMAGDRHVGFYGNTGLNSWGLVMNTDNGNVGIGIGAADTSAKLEINGNTLIDRDLYVNQIVPPSGRLTVAGNITANSFAVNNNAFKLRRMMSMNNIPAINFKPAGFLGRPDSWVVIGTPGAPVDLFVNGNIAASGLIQDRIPWPSDVRLKKEIEPIQGALEKVLQMHGVTFEWKDPATYGKGPQIGVIAQEVEKVFPQVVSTGPDGFKRVDYPKLTAPLIEAIRQLKTENSALKTKNTELEARVKVLEEKVNKK